MSIKWLDKKPHAERGISWGMPWKEGELQVADVSMINRVGQQLIQTKVMAYWPDGSVKWTGNAGIFSRQTTDLVFTKGGDESLEVLAIERYNGVYVDTGKIQIYFPKHGEGTSLIEWVKSNNQTKLERLALVAKTEDGISTSQISSVTIEENGPIKSVIKVNGFIEENGKNLQEFVVRFKFYKDMPTIDITHTIIINSKREICGIGLVYHTVIVGENWNRHVRIAGETGMYTEPAQLLLSRRFSVDNRAYEQQTKGEMVNLGDTDKAMLDHAKENAVWHDFSISQLSPEFYELTKQTTQSHGKIQIGTGNKAKGTLYAGGIGGGVACSLENFWKKVPSQLEVQGLGKTRTRMLAWLWSPEGQPIDFTHYSDKDHMLSAYEGMEEIRSTPIGIANTSHLSLTCFNEVPTNEQLWALAKENEQQARLVMEPKDYHDTKVFGIWSLPKTTTPTHLFLESQLAAFRSFYQLEVKQRNWYGYWNYGDVMHTYDPYRHVWRYDMGGYAWQNTELVPNMWLWQDFLRTGSKEAFSLAEAMTIHTSEVDQYHLGEYRGLGSRHNVLHWGCQCKEARISMAGLHRYYYFLTCDERMGDILREVADNETVFEKLEPLREFYQREDNQRIPIRVGPDWAALTSNWFTNWELTGDKSYYKNISTGIRSIEETPYQLISGPTYQFNPKSKKLDYYGTGNVGGYHMIISFGAPQVWLEIAESIKDPVWNQMLADFGKFYALSDQEKRNQSNGLLDDSHFAWPMFATGMMGFAASYYQDKKLAKKAWEILLTPHLSGIPLPVESTIHEVTTWKDIREMPWISTNVVSQWCLNIMLCLELIDEALPEITIESEEKK